jgi:hypothetical protein
VASSASNKPSRPPWPVTGIALLSSSSSSYYYYNIGVWAVAAAAILPDLPDM